jgi:hypothetical protein
MQGVDVSSELDLLVLEYLAHAGYERATQQLKQELREKREGKSTTWRPVGAGMQDRVKDRMLRALDAGEREEVLRLWDNFVPPVLRRTDKNAQKLEFYLNIFFAIFPLHPTNPKGAQPAGLTNSMRIFKEYLETDGAALAVTPEFLAYYAMPYVPEIARHPSFRELFTAEWALALKSRLADFLARTPQFAAEPKLLSMVRAHRELGAGAAHGAAHPIDGARADVQALKQRLIDSELRAVEAKREAAAAVAAEEEREHAMRRGLGDMSDIAADAIQQLAYTSGDARTVQQMQGRLHVAEERYDIQRHTFGQRQSQKQQQSAESPGAPQQQHSPGAPPTGGSPGAPDALKQTMSMLASLDYAAIKAAILAGEPDVPLLMQALRWRLTKTQKQQRKTALVQFIQNDLLEANVMDALMGGRPDVNALDAAVQEQALRMINLFASEPAGRTYLLGQPDLIERLCRILTSDVTDTVARQNCLGALQKLSLRRQPQNTMIDADVIAWLVQQLADIDALTAYSVQYGTALLMNLSLRTAGKSKCAESELDILNVLSQLMEHESMQVRTYINGTLYSILVKASLKSRAEEIGLPEQLKLQMGHSDETFARQINYILEQIEKEPQPEDDEPQSEEEGAEEEEEEEEEEGAEEGGADEEDEVDVFPEAQMDLGAAGGSEGEDLLSRRYLQTDVDAAEEDAQQLQQSMRMEDERRSQAALNSSQRPNDMTARKRHHPDEPLQRPATPRAADGKEDREGKEKEKVDYGELAMQQSGALKEDEGGEGQGGADGDEGEGGDEGQLAPSAYPDPDSVDPNSPTISVRNRLARTPSRTTRGPAPPGSQPLQPTAPRARANVAPLQRSRKEDQPVGGGNSPNPPGGSRANKGGTKPPGAFEGVGEEGA